MRAFSTLKAKVREFARDECGPTATEYAVLLALIIVGLIGTVTVTGQQLIALYAYIRQGLDPVPG